MIHRSVPSLVESRIILYVICEQHHNNYKASKVHLLTQTDSQSVCNPKRAFIRSQTTKTKPNGCEHVKVTNPH